MFSCEVSSLGPPLPSRHVEAHEAKMAALKLDIRSEGVKLRPKQKTA